MDIKRAREIASSPVMANATYNGEQIYIDNVNDDNNTANIHPLSQPEIRKKVNISSLFEP